jgi:predicted nuclease with RNAse H fold
MLTVGVDLSAEDKKTCMASIQWNTDGALVVDLQTRVNNHAIVRAAADAEKVGIDCPFGWPISFVEFITEHAEGSVRPRRGVAIDWRRALANRSTDLVVRDRTPLIPLSVSADRISHAAMRCAALLSELAAAGVPVDRSGQTGAVAEVYPAASLYRWNLTYRGYKRPENSAKLNGLVDDLLTLAPWLKLSKYESLCRESDDAFDGVIAAMTARAVICKLTEPPTATQVEAAQREGWIVLPKQGSLERLTILP